MTPGPRAARTRRRKLGFLAGVIASWGRCAAGSLDESPGRGAALPGTKNSSRGYNPRMIRHPRLLLVALAALAVAAAATVADAYGLLPIPPAVLAAMRWLALSGLVA